MSQHINKENQTFENLRIELQDLKLAFESLKNTYENDSSVIRYRQNQEENRIKDLIIETSINPVAISDLQGDLTYVNQAFYKLLGYSSGNEIIGKPIAEYWHAGKKADEIIDTIKQDGTWTGELQAQKKGGEVIDVHVSASIMKDIKGQPVSMLASFNDISLYKHAEKNLTASDTSYHELFNNVKDAIYIQDENGTFLDVNEGAVKMYGYPREVLIGKNPLFVSAPGKNNMEAIGAMVKKAFAGEPQQFEFWGLRQTEKYFQKKFVL